VGLVKRTFINNRGFFLTNVIVILVGIIFAIVAVGLLEKDSNFEIILLSIGTSIIAAGIVSFLDLLRGEKVQEVYKGVENVVRIGGIENVYQRRDLAEYMELVIKSKSSIDIMGYSLHGFYESNKEILLEKCKNNPDFLVRIILVNPASKFSMERDVEEYEYNSGIFKATFENLKNWSKDRENIQIRLIDSQLSDMIYRIDDVMYTGPYFYKKSSKETYTNRLNKNGWLFKAYQENFDKMWNDSKKQNNFEWRTSSIV